MLKSESKKLILYELNPRFFKDDSNDGVGDLKGLASKFSYFNFLDVDGVILQDILSTDSNEKNQSFDRIASELGSETDFIKVLDLAKKQNIKILIEMNIGSIKESNSWFSNALVKGEGQSKDLIRLYDKDREKIKNTKTVEFKYDVDNKSYYALNGKTQEVPLNWKSDQVMSHYLNVIDYWYQKGVSGFVFKNFEYIFDTSQTNPMGGDVLRELRKFYKAIKEISSEIVIVGKSDVLTFDESARYTESSVRIFDYLMLTNLSMLGTKNNSIDYIGKFKLSDLAEALKLMHNNYSSLVSFGSSRVGRVTSRWINEGQFHAESVKSLFLLLLISKSSNSIYYGDEIGTKNIGLTYLDDFSDPEIGNRKKQIVNSNYSERDFMSAQVLQNPINSKSVLAWNDEKNGGFSNANRLINPLPNSYRQVNVAMQFNDSRSILNFNRELISLVKSEAFSEILEKGSYSIKMSRFGLVIVRITYGDSKIAIFANLSDSSKPIFFHKLKSPKIILSSYSHKSYGDVIPRRLEPYESILAISNITIASIKTKRKVKVVEKVDNTMVNKKVQSEIKLSNDEANEALTNNSHETSKSIKKVNEVKKAEKTSELKVREVNSAKTDSRRKDAKDSNEITTLKESEIAHTTLVDINEAKDIEELIKKLDKKHKK